MILVGGGGGVGDSSFHLPPTMKILYPCPGVQCRNFNILHVRKVVPISYRNLIYKMGHYFLDIQYMEITKS